MVKKALQHNNSTTTHLECMLPIFGWSEHQPHSLTISDGSMSISFFSVLFIELQEQHSYLNYPYMVILQGIYVALRWSEN